MARGVGNLVKIYGNMNTEKYNQSLIHLLMSSGKFLIGNSFVCQYENYPKYTAIAVKAGYINTQWRIISNQLPSTEPEL